jgi:hypothetical protein
MYNATAGKPKRYPVSKEKPNETGCPAAEQRDELAALHSIVITRRKRHQQVGHCYALL